MTNQANIARGSEAQEPKVDDRERDSQGKAITSGSSPTKNRRPKTSKTKQGLYNKTKSPCLIKKNLRCQDHGHGKGTGDDSKRRPIAKLLGLRYAWKISHEEGMNRSFFDDDCLRRPFYNSI